MSFGQSLMENKIKSYLSIKENIYISLFRLHDFFNRLFISQAEQFQSLIKINQSLITLNERVSELLLSDRFMSNPGKLKKNYSLYVHILNYLRLKLQISDPSQRTSILYLAYRCPFLVDLFKKYHNLIFPGDNHDAVDMAWVDFQYFPNGDTSIKDILLSAKYLVVFENIDRDELKKMTQFILWECGFSYVYYVKKLDVTLGLRLGTNIECVFDSRPDIDYVICSRTSL